MEPSETSSRTNIHQENKWLTCLFAYLFKMLCSHWLFIQTIELFLAMVKNKSADSWRNMNASQKDSADWKDGRSENTQDDSIYVKL